MVDTGARGLGADSGEDQGPLASADLRYGRLFISEEAGGIGASLFILAARA
jgi:hypothetical protein